MMKIQIENELKSLANAEKAAFVTSYFKANEGGYAQGDKFLGISVPEQRLVAKHYYKEISLEDLQHLIKSSFHEVRLTTLLMLVFKYEKTKSIEEKNQIVQFYVKNTVYINNWDLVDSTAYKILGRHCFEQNDVSVLKQFSKSDNLWENRIAVIATLYFIKKGKFKLTKELVLANMNHSHDLMHKANGWMLREIGQQNQEELLSFLREHYKKMPRTSLRYAIEKLDIFEREDFLKGRI